MGDSFIDEGSHNIIEPLRLLKTVAVGPSIWGIEYPAAEALEASILTRHTTPKALLDHWLADTSTDKSVRISEFIVEHGDVTQRAIALLKAHGFLL
jgi:3-deoxy-D-manno-octulosonic-acid transferase